ncbi:MAG: phosphotransferase [Propionibacteriaceae bacterium]
MVDREAAEQLLGYISSARWFAGKGRLAELAGVTPLPWLTEIDQWPAVRSEVAEIRYLADQDPDDPDAERTVSATELYQLAVSYRSAPQPGLQHAEIGRFTDPELGPVVAYDAMQDPDACRLFLERLLEPRRHASDEARVSFHLVSGDALSPEKNNNDLEPRIFTGQQSNTSVMFGDTAMLKLFRRLEIGHNLDIEVHESLSRSGVADVAQLYGWVEASWPGSDPEGPQSLNADLAMMVEKLAQAEDGWGLALDSLRADQDFSGRARALGQALAEIHHALRDAFPTAQADGAQTAQIMKDRLAVAVAIAPALEPHLAGLTACFDALAGVQLATQRVHGDFHLGQTLYTPDGWKIIDFEGEPVKTLAERAAPDSVWRDIAGMLRSFDYGAASVPGPDSQAWADACRTAFLEGYAGGPLAPGDAAVLDAYVADKAVYEVVYEVRNRPDWVNIPLAAVAAIAAASTSAPAAASTAAAPAAASTASATADQVKE